MKSSKSKLWILMITAFIDMVGLLMVLPLLPFYAKSLGQGGLVVGLLVSSFAVAQLLTAPMWGRLSDAYGRRPAMLVGLTASAIAYIIFAFVVTMAIRVPDLGVLVPHWILQPFDPNDKTNLAPYRVVHFMALAVVVTRFLHLDSPILQWRALAPLISCGQHSLEVFCTGIVLSFCAHAAIELSLNSLWVQIFVGATGISLMTAVAYCRTRLKQRDRVLPSPIQIGELA